MCCIIPAADAGTYYVSPAGSDANSGSQNAPWLTLSHAVSTATSGDTVYVAPGHYNTNTIPYTPLHLNVPGQTFIASSGCFTKNVWFEATNVVFTNFVIGENFGGGFSGDPIVWFKAGSDGSKLQGGAVFSQVGYNQYGLLFSGTNAAASGVEITNFGASGVCVAFTGNSNQVVNCSIHDNGSVEGVFYVWGDYNLVASCVISNNNELEKVGSHPDLFQSFFAESWGNVISNNLAINNSCQFGSLQAVDGSTPGATYATNAGGWTFVNNVFINTGSKLDVDFRDMKFLNNTFYNCMDNSSEGQVINFNWSIYGQGTNGVMVNNLFVLCGSDPTAADQGWFGVSEGTNTQNLIRNSMTVSNNFVVGSAFGSKNTNLFIGTNWVNGGNPKFLSAPSSRIHKLNLTGTTDANNTTNITGTGTSFTTELAVGDRITLGPYWTNTPGRVVAIINATNLWTDVPIGTGVSTKYGGPQSIQRLQNYDPMPDLRLLSGSLAIGAGASLSNPVYDRAGNARPVGSAYTIGAYEGATAEVVPTNMVLHITFNNWGGGTNALDSTTNHCDAALFGYSTNWPTSGIGPDGGSAAQILNYQYFGITNITPILNMTNGTVAVWAKHNPGYTETYSYILDANYPFPATNGWGIFHDPQNTTKLYVTDSENTRLEILTYSDFGDTNWHHYAFTWAGTNCIGYFDGIAFQTNALPSPVLTLDNANWLAIGTMQHDGTPQLGDDAYPNSGWLNGNIADIRMYNTTLSATDLLNVYYVAASPSLPIDTTPTPGGSLPAQLVMHLNFDGWNGKTNVLDATSNKVNAVSFGLNGPTLTAGPFGTNVAAHFGFGQWLAVTNTSAFEYLTNGTIAMWINFDKPVGTGDYCAMDGWYAYPDTNCFWVGAPFGSASMFRSFVNSSTYQTINFGDWGVSSSWHHYGITWDGSNVVAYFDGNPILTNSQAVTFFHVESTSRWLALGAQHGSHTADSPCGGWLNGSLADVRFYNYALTPTNLSQLAQYQEPLPIISRPPSPVHLRIATN